MTIICRSKTTVDFFNFCVNRPYVQRDWCCCTETMT